VQELLKTASKGVQNGSYCSGNERYEVEMISELLALFLPEGYAVAL
jgi:hypothetical protein